MSARVSLAGRDPIWLLLAAFLCAATGVLAGIAPKLGLEVALGLGFSALVLGNVEVGLALFTVLSFFEVFNFGGAAVSFIKVAGLLLVGSWLAASTTRREQRPGLLAASPLLAWSAVAFVSWSAVSAVWAGNASTANGSTERFLLNALLLPLVFNTVRSRRHLTWVVAAFCGAAAVSAAYGFLQTVGGRAGGAIGDPNEEAAVLTAALCLALGLMSTQPPGSARRVWIALGAAVSALGFLGTLSRGGLISAGFVLIAAPLVGGRWRARALAAIVVAAAVTGVYFATVASTTAVQRVTSSGTSGRSSLWKVGLKMFEANPILGVGSANFQPEAVRYVQQTTNITRADLIVASPHVVHNTYLEAADDMGIPGLVMLLLILFASLRAAWQAAHRYQRAGDSAGELLSRMFILALLGILAADFFIVGQYSKQLWLLLGLGPVLLALAPDDEREAVPALSASAAPHGPAQRRGRGQPALERGGS